MFPINTLFVGIMSMKYGLLLFCLLSNFQRNQAVFVVNQSSENVYVQLMGDHDWTTCGPHPKDLKIIKFVLKPEGFQYSDLDACAIGNPPRAFFGRLKKMETLIIRDGENYERKIVVSKEKECESTKCVLL